MERAPIWFLSFDVEGTPQPQGSTRAFPKRNGGVIVTSDNLRLRPWRERVYWAAMEHKPSELVTGPVSIGLLFRLPVPKSAPKRRRIWPAKRPDLSKLLRAVEDSLTGVIWVDDAQVVEALIRKEYAYDAQPPGVTITVEELA